VGRYDRCPHALGFDLLYVKVDGCQAGDQVNLDVYDAQSGQQAIADRQSAHRTMHPDDR
jgi:hypothetical protein